MIIEHVAFNVTDPVKIAEWYVQNLGFKIAMSIDEGPFTHFLADERGGMFELYCNPIDEVPDYSSMNPLVLHLAFVSNDPDLDREKMEKAGAIFLQEDKLDDGTHIVMMKDPWGFSIQFCKRGKPFV